MGEQCVYLSRAKFFLTSSALPGMKTGNSSNYYRGFFKRRAREPL